MEFLDIDSLMEEKNNIDFPVLLKCEATLQTVFLADQEKPNFIIELYEEDLEACRSQNELEDLVSNKITSYILEFLIDWSYETEIKMKEEK